MNSPNRHRLPLILLLVPLVYLALRIPGLWSAWIFNDEANYGIWIAQMLGRPSLETALVPWHDDKIGYLLWTVAVLDAAGWPASLGPVLLWRWLSLGCGLVTIVLIMRLAWLLAGPDRNRATIAALAAGLGWAAWPLAVIHERMAMFDGPLAMTWIMAAVAIETMRLKKTISLRHAALAGVACALPLAIKLNGIPAIVIGSAVVIYYWKRGRMSQKAATAFFVTNDLIFIPTIAIGLACGTMMAARQFHGGPGQLSLIANTLGLLGQIGDMLWTSIFIPALIAIVVGIFIKSQPNAEGLRIGKLYLVLWTLLPFLMILAIGRHPAVYTRYYIPYMTPVWVAFGIGIAALTAWISKRIAQPSAIAAILLIVCLTFPIYQSVLWLKAPDRMCLTPLDRFQYVTAWPSGRQIDSLRAVIAPMMEKKPVKLLSLNNFINPVSGLHYLERLRSDRLELVVVGDLSSASLQMQACPPTEIRLALEISETPQIRTDMPPAAKIIWRDITRDPKYSELRLWAMPQQ